VRHSVVKKVEMKDGAGREDEHNCLVHLNSSYEFSPYLKEDRTYSWQRSVG
jgi:hypothetical protein